MQSLAVDEEFEVRRVVLWPWFTVGVRAGPERGGAEGLQRAFVETLEKPPRLWLLLKRDLTTLTGTPLLLTSCGT